MAANPQQTIESPSVNTDAEAGLRCEAGEIKAQAKQAWMPDEGGNLLEREKHE